MLYTCAEGLRALAVLLSPVMPQSTEKLWVALGAAESLGASAGPADPRGGSLGRAAPRHERQRARAAVPARGVHRLSHG